MFETTTFLITGGTGSFGQACVKSLLKLRPRKIIVFSRDELKQSEMRKTIPDIPPSKVRYFVGDVRDRDRLSRAMHEVDIIIHAAALKQVPTCEYNPLEAIRTNIDGAANVIDAAIDNEVGKVIALSTDKAVNPVNLYGATKLCMEKLFINANTYSHNGRPKFSCTRYGNVWGSRGSFKTVIDEAIRNGVPIPITDVRMTRFHIEVSDAVDFVLSSLQMMQGGEIFIPKMWSNNIMEWVGSKDYEVIGIRPGEKLHEVLISSEEARHTVELPDRFIILPENPYFDNYPYLTYQKVPEGFIYSSEEKH